MSSIQFRLAFVGLSDSFIGRTTHIKCAGAKQAVAHPAILKRYEEQLPQLENALGRGVSAGDAEAAEAIRDLVEAVTVFRYPARQGGVTVEIADRLNASLGQEAYPNRVKGVW